MTQLDTTKVAKVLADAGQALRSVTSERDKLAQENSLLKRRFEAQKLAAAMHEKGIHLDVDQETLVGDLEKAAEEGRLSTIQEAVNLVVPNMGFTATLTSDETLGGGSNAFESFILGDVG